MLCCKFGFHRTCDTWLTRIRGATIAISFEDAPRKPTDPFGEDPAVVGFYPANDPYTGTKSYGAATASVQLNTSIASALPVNFKATYSKPVESELVISGTTVGKGMFRVVWNLRENEVSESGMPRAVTFPVIVAPRGKRRFKATLDIRMQYVWVSNHMPGTAPLVGKDVEPVFFDPVVLDQLAREGDRSKVDKKTIVTVFDGETLENIKLEEYSHISVC